MLVDSHCHLVSYKYDEEELSEIISRAEASGISKMVTLATSVDDCPKHLALAQAHSSVFCCIGIHPCDVHETPDNYLDLITPYAQDENCVAIGETGLDYYHPAPEGWTQEDYHQRQRDLLEQHFELASTLNKNIVIHTRDRSGTASLDDALKIYARWNDTVQAVFHCFLGPLDNAKHIFELGGLISFTGIATFKSAKDCLAAAVSAEKGTFMVETDAPYLAPTPYRGKRCEPAYTRNTAEFIANARGESLEKFAQHTTQTANSFYKFKKS